MVVTIGLLQYIGFISLCIIEVAFESRPAVLVIIFQLCALQRMLHDSWNVIDLQQAIIILLRRPGSVAE